MLEIEIKALCGDHSSIEKKIISLGGHFIKKVIEKDIYFKHPARDFTYTDEALRIRLEDDKTILTYKGPKIGDKTKTRIEQEVEFKDPDSMMDILKSLGFEIVERINKTRSLYMINDIKICLDHVHELGDFIELEKKGHDREKGEKKLFELAARLGLAQFERRSYLELKLEKKKTPIQR